MPNRYVVAPVQLSSTKGGMIPCIVVDLDYDGVCCSKLLTRQEALDKADLLNDRVAILAHWPSPDDPEVEALANSEDFVPQGQDNLETLNSPVYRLHQAAETIARRRAGKPNA